MVEADAEYKHTLIGNEIGKSDGDRPSVGMLFCGECPQKTKENNKT